MFLLGVLLLHSHKMESLYPTYSSSDGHDICIGFIDRHVQWLLAFVCLLFSFLFEQVFFKLPLCLLRALATNIPQQPLRNIIKKDKEKQRLQYGFILIHLCLLFFCSVLSHTVVFGRTAVTHHTVLLQIQNIHSCLLAFLYNVPK